MFEGSSLLPAGVTGARGRFDRGDTVSVFTADGIEMARGIVAYSDADAARIMGRRSTEIADILGFRGRDEMIHRDDLVLLREEVGVPVTPTPTATHLKATMHTQELGEMMEGLGRAALAAAAVLARASTVQKDAALAAAAAAVRRGRNAILAANARDLAAAAAHGLSGARLERLRLDAERLEAIAAGIEAVRALPDPIGTVAERWERPNGLRIERVIVPLGVIGIIYESRPNVTADAGALCLKSGNAVILRGGSDSEHSNRALHACLAAALEAAALPATCIQLVPTSDRAAVGYMLAGMSEYLDVIVPRGGKALVQRVQQEARVPVIGHLEGNCHVYVDRDADVRMARAIALNAKMRRTGICGAAETLLVDAACAATHLAPIIKELLDAGCEVRGDASVQSGRCARARGARGGLVHRIPGRDHRRARGRWRRCGDRAHRALRLGAHRVDRHRQRGDRRALPGAGRQRHRAAQRLHAVRRRRRVRHGRGDRHLHRSLPRPRSGRGVEQLTSYKYLVRGTGQVRA